MRKDGCDREGKLKHAAQTREGSDQSAGLQKFSVHAPDFIPAAVGTELLRRCAACKNCKECQFT